MARGVGRWAAGCIGLLLAGCGGSDAPPPAGDVPDPGPQGYYTGSLVSQTSGLTISAFALVGDDGRIHIVEPGLGRQFLVSFPAADGGWHAALTGHAGSLTDFPDGSARCTGHVDGSAFAAAELTGSYACGGDHGSFDLVYDDTVSFEPPDVGGLTGLAEDDSATGDVTLLSIAPDGTFTGSDTMGCSYAGSLSAADPIINVYAMQLHWTCAGHSVAMSGLATLASHGGAPALYYAVADAFHSRAGILVFQ